MVQATTSITAKFVELNAGPSIRGADDTTRSTKPHPTMKARCAFKIACTFVASHLNWDDPQKKTKQTALM